MINLPTNKELNELKAFKEPFCLTIYMPLIGEKGSGMSNPNRIELKNLLKQAKIALMDIGVRSRQIQKTLAPANILVENREFWPATHASLALFMHPKLFRHYHIPDQNIPHMLTVEKGFNLEPLIRVIKNNKRYYLLTLSYKNINLYEGDHYSLKPLRLKNFPTDMKKTLGIDEYPKWSETQAVKPAYMGKGSEAFHGQYNDEETNKEMLLEFFHRVDKRLHEYLRGRHEPLIIAGVEYLLPIYRQVNTYPYLLADSITGNLERVNLDTIRVKAWRLVSKK